MYELSLMCPEDRVETLSDALDALDALSVSVEDADAQTDAEQALFGEPGMPPPKDGWQRSRVLALFAQEAQASEALELLAAQDFFVGCQVLGVAAVPDQDWVRLTQSQFTPVDITPEFWIVPTWHEPPAQATRVIRLDPGLAFGTGTHPTTRMCLRWIARQAAAPGLGRVLALFAQEAQASEALDLLSAQDFFAGCQVLGVAAVPDQDWVRLTQSQFTPVDITPEFWIVPTWHEPPAEATRVIRLDPGLAFGTGTHPTTRMCLRWIARQAATPGLGRVLDYGCGSGILAIGAAKFGATDIDAVDIDTAAVESTEYNANANEVQLNAGLPDKAKGRYQTVLANILATPLKVLAPLLHSYVADGGQLVLAGILERQAQELKDAYAPYLALTVADTEDGWILMTGSR